MVPIMSLWVPILLSAVFVFVASSIIHTVLRYHRSDFGKVPREDEVMDALGGFSIPPGDYIIPHAGSMKEMGEPEFMEKANRGPVAFMTVLPNGPIKMGKSLTQWFVYTVVVGAIAAYVTGRALGPGAEYLAVYRFAGTTAFVGYAVGLWQNSIWLKHSWTMTLKSTFDGFVYAMLTGGVFGWLWPA
jgi:hypothetical protein